MIERFLEDPAVGAAPIAAASFGVAGPVLGERAQLTNVPWEVDARAVVERFGFARVRLLNDLESMAYAVPALHPSELHVLQHGESRDDGNLALIAAGTGLGEALLHRIDGRLRPSSSEGGHADFAARTEREIRLLRALTGRFGRVDVERVVSGHGLSNIFPVAHERACRAGIAPEAADAPAAISNAALEGRCPGCVETLDIFVEAYGAEAGNLALRSVATGGVFVGGGIAPKILPALARGGFMNAFRAKAPLDALLARIPVAVILNADAGLLGAAIHAGMDSAL
jgi:glucokinase